jgi:hypothetical protein
MTLAALLRQPYRLAARAFGRDIPILIRHTNCNDELPTLVRLSFRLHRTCSVTQLRSVIDRRFLINSYSISILRILKIA